MTGSPTAHFLVCSLGAWGHARPLAALCGNLLLEYPTLVITFLATPFFKKRVTEIIAKLNDPSVSARFRVVGVAPPKNPASGDEAPSIETINLQMADYNGNIHWAIDACMAGARFSDADSEFEALKVIPTMAITDSFIVNFIDLLKEASDAAGVPTPPVTAFLPSFAFSVIQHWGTVEQGALYTGVPEKARGFMEKEGITWNEGVMKCLMEWATSPKPIQLPVCNPMMPYEFSPQMAAMPMPPIELITDIINAREKILKQSVGMILPGLCRELTPGGREAINVALPGIEVLEVGPQLSPADWDPSVLQDKGSEEDQRIMSFLDSVLAEKGPNSVMYISLGSIFFPVSRPDLIDDLIDSLIEAKFPFLMATASPLSNLSEQTVAKIEASPYAMRTLFAPQQRVLHHKSVGWFFSHAGSNSVSESIAASVPMVLLPFAADQPESANYLSQVAKVAVEPVQMKTGAIGAPMCRGDTPLDSQEARIAELKNIWEVIRGEEGDAMRERMGKLRETIAMSWEEGESRNALKSFAKWM